jgi:hypothetical protein
MLLGNDQVKQHQDHQHHQMYTLVDEVILHEDDNQRDLFLIRIMGMDESQIKTIYGR